MDGPQLRSPLSVRQVAEHIFETRRITRKDQCLLMHLLSSGSLGEEEQILVEKIYASLRKGFIRVVD